MGTIGTICMWIKKRWNKGKMISNLKSAIFVSITANPSTRKLFPSSPTNEKGEPAEDYDKVIAYGQVTWKEAFGPDGGLQLCDIPFTYTTLAEKQAPKYIVIVASASKFGDYFSGSASSVMYLDDFELIYE